MLKTYSSIVATQNMDKKTSKMGGLFFKTSLKDTSYLSEEIIRNILAYTDSGPESESYSEARKRTANAILKAMKLKTPSLFFRALKDCALLHRVLPSLDRCYDLDGGFYHAETVFEHCMLVGDALPPALPLLRLAGYLHDTGKYDAAKIEDGNLYFKGHENHFEKTENDLRELRLPEEHTAYIVAVMKVHMHPLTDKSSPKSVSRLLSRLSGLKLTYKDFMRMRIADRKGNLSKKAYTLSEIKIRLKKIYNEINTGASES